MAPIRGQAALARPRTSAARSSETLTMTRFVIRAASFAISAASAFGFQPPTPARELVNGYCLSCHNEKLKTAGLLLDRMDADHPANSAETWETAIVKLRSR